MLAVVAVLVTISAGANLLGTYMIRPVVNGLADGDVHTLLCGVLITALIFGCGALAAYGYTQTMVKAAQQVVFDIRRDLFEHVQTLPLQFFDSRRHGDIMSLFTNDIDTMADALNNSFAMVIQSFIQIVGTLTLLYILNWRLSLIVTVCYGIMFWYIKFSGKRSKGYYTKQQNSLGELNGYIEELITGQKVVKVFHHEEESFTEFCKRMRSSGKREPARKGMRRRWFLSLSAFRMSIMRLWQCSAAFSPCTESRYRKPGKLPCLCPPGGASDQPVHPAEQLPSLSARRCGACLRRDEPGAGNRRGKSGTGQRKRRERRTCRLRRDNRPLGMEAPGWNDDGIKGRCAF